MIEIEASTIEPLILTIRIILSLIGLLFSSAVLLPLLFSWHANGLFGRVFAISMASGALGQLFAIYIRIATLNTDLAFDASPALNPEHWHTLFLVGIANSIVVGFFVPIANTFHLACIDANIHKNPWVKRFLLLNYCFVAFRLVLGLVAPQTIVETITISATRDLSFVRHPYAIIYPLLSLLTLLATFGVLLRWPSKRIWELVANRTAIIIGFLMIPTALGQLFSGLHIVIIYTLASMHMASFYYRFPETNITRRINESRQKALQRTDFLYRIGRLLNENLDSIEVFKTLADETRSIFNAKHVTLELLAADQVAVSQFTSGTALATATTLPLKPQAIETKTLTHNETDMVGPILVQDELLGVIEVQGINSVDDYEQDLLNGIAQQAGTAIKNIQLLAAEQKARVQAEVLFDVAQAATEELKAETETRKTLEIAAAIQAERDRIGRETHDGLLQRFSGQRLRIDHWRNLLKPHQTDLLTEFDTMEHELGRGTTELRRLIQGLHTGEIQTAFGKKLAESNALSAETYGFSIHNDLSFDADHLGKDAQHELARIIQEAINNAGKHAQATDIWLTDTLLTDDSGVQIQIKDNGVGFDTSQTQRTTSFGLKNMKVRTALLGGTFRIQSTVGTGTTIQLTIPFDEETA